MEIQILNQAKNVTHINSVLIFLWNKKSMILPGKTFLATPKQVRWKEKDTWTLTEEWLKSGKWGGSAADDEGPLRRGPTLGEITRLPMGLWNKLGQVWRRRLGEEMVPGLGWDFGIAARDLSFDHHLCIFLLVTPSLCVDCACSVRFWCTRRWGVWGDLGFWGWLKA